MIARLHTPVFNNGRHGIQNGLVGISNRLILILYQLLQMPFVQVQITVKGNGEFSLIYMPLAANIS